MTLKDGPPCFLLLIVAAAVLAAPSETTGRNRPSYKNVVKKLMIKCHEKGHSVPPMALLKTVFSESNMEGRDGRQAETLLSPFLRLLSSATGEENLVPVSPAPEDLVPVSPAPEDLVPVSPAPEEEPHKTKNNLWKCRHLSAILQQMRNTTEASECYMRAYMAPVAWAALRAKCENDIDPNQFDDLLWAAKPILEESPSARRDLPTELDQDKMEPMMKMLQGVYVSMADSEKTWVAKWAKNQIIQNKFNCTMKPPSDPSAGLKKSCTAAQRQLNLEVLTVMGSFMSHMTTGDVDLSRKEKTCEFFRSGLLDMMKETTPTRCRWFLRIYQACFSGEEYLNRLDKLGPLTCCLSDVPHLPPDVNRKVLAQLDCCKNSKAKTLKKRLVRLYMRLNSSTEALQDLGKNTKFLAPKLLLDIDPEAMREIFRKQSLQWTANQQCILVKNQLGDTCDEMFSKELKDFQSVAEALPVCVIKRLKANEILNDTEALKNISRRLRRGALKAILQKIPVEVLKNKTMPQRLACLLSLSTLKKANISSPEQMENKTWCRAQAAYLVKRMKDVKQVNFRKMRSLLGGLTCKMIEEAADIKELARIMDEAPQWVSKTQVRCVARNLSLALEKERKDYFKTITEEELENIPTRYVLHLPPPALRDLPDSICPAFLEKLEQANLSMLAQRDWSRPALISRALRCLANGTGLSGLTVQNVSKLGELFCELPPSNLTLVAPDVMESILRKLADCQDIPKRHQKDLVRLVRNTFGNPSNWTAETFENIGPLIMLDDDAVSALPNKPEMKDVFSFLMSKRRRVSAAVKKKWFELVTEPSSDTNADPNATASDGHRKLVTPTEQLIDEVGASNCFWAPSQLKNMSKETFLNAAETLGSCSNFSTEQLAVLRNKVTEAFGRVSEITACQLMQLGCITQSFSDPDLETLPFSLDSLEEIARCSWTDSQMRSVWRGVAKRYGLMAARLGAVEMLALSRFMCGLNISEIQLLNIEAFKDAVGSMEGICCTSRIIKSFKSVAVAAFGAPDNWDEAQISELSSIVPGLDPPELASLRWNVFSFIHQTVISEIPPDCLKALSDDQLRSFGPDNAAAVTAEQLRALNATQLAALDEAATGSRSATGTSQDSGGNAAADSGAPSLSVDGISALMKPLLFLLTGLLLL